MGTGEYATKNQLKFIHRTVDHKASGKKATFHITIRQSVLDEINIESEDAL